MSGCAESQTSGEALRHQAEHLAAVASAYFEEHGHIPAAPPYPTGSPCCGARCPAATSAALPALSDPKWNLSGGNPFRRWGLAPRWVQLDLKGTDRELIASASGDWDCDGTAEAYEARWSLINGKVSRITVTETASPRAAR